MLLHPAIKLYFYGISFRSSLSKFCQFWPAKKMFLFHNVETFNVKLIVFSSYGRFSNLLFSVINDSNSHSFGAIEDIPKLKILILIFTDIMKYLIMLANSSCIV